MPQPRTRSAAADDVFLKALENGHSVGAACAMARYARRCVYRWRAQDSAFAARWAGALQMAGDLLEEEADRRGRDGFDVPVFFRGQSCGTKRKYADGLLLARLKAIRPESYRERTAPPLAPPVQPQPFSVVLREFALEDLVRRLLRGDTVAEVLDYVQFQARTLLDQFRRDVERAVREGKMGYEESGRLLRFYEEGLYGYTYLEESSHEK